MEEKNFTVANADSCGEVAKIKTHFAKIIVEGTAEHPYYSILYYDPAENDYYNGFGSYYIKNVFQWLKEEFEIVVEKEVVRCKDCKYYKNSKIPEMDGIKFCYRLRGGDGEPVGYNFSEDDFCSRGEWREECRCGSSG